MKSPYTYYHAKLSDVTAPDVCRLFDDLRLFGGWKEKEHDDLRVFAFLRLFFVHTNAGKINQTNVHSISALDQKVSSLAGSEVYVLCRELAQEVREHFEGSENKKLLGFLKKMTKKLG